MLVLAHFSWPSRVWNLMETPGYNFSCMQSWKVANLHKVIFLHTFLLQDIFKGVFSIGGGEEKNQRTMSSCVYHRESNGLQSLLPFSESSSRQTGSRKESLCCDLTFFSPVTEFKLLLHVTCIQKHSSFDRKRLKLEPESMSTSWCWQNVNVGLCLHLKLCFKSSEQHL